jgi:PhzF family phenazine biosynthesis protein
MQRFANWTNLSETTFVTAAAGSEYHVRIFTPRAELPFAGHPTVGTATALLQLGRIAPEDGKLVQHCGLGAVELAVDDGMVFTSIPQRALRRIDCPELSACFGGVALDSPMSIDVGPVWLVARVFGGVRELEGLRPDFAAVIAVEHRHAVTGVSLYAVDDEEVHVRSFAPGSGIPEDPVCGSGNGAVARHLHELGHTAEQYVARQGRCVGRDGVVHVRWHAGTLQVGGHAVRVVSGSLSC